MYYRTNPVSNQKISLLGFGAMRFPTTEDGKIDRPRAEEMLDQAYKAGINILIPLICITTENRRTFWVK